MSASLHCGSSLCQTQSQRHPFAFRNRMHTRKNSLQKKKKIHFGIPHTRLINIVFIYLFSEINYFFLCALSSRFAYAYVCACAYYNEYKANRQWLVPFRLADPRMNHTRKRFWLFCFVSFYFWENKNRLAFSKGIFHLRLKFSFSITMCVFDCKCFELHTWESVVYHAENINLYRHKKTHTKKKRIIKTVTQEHKEHDKSYSWWQWQQCASRTKRAGNGEM